MSKRGSSRGLVPNANIIGFWKKLRWHLSGKPQMDHFFGHDVSPEPVRFDGPRRLAVVPQYFTLETYLNQADRADWQNCDPRIVRFAAHFVETLRKKGVPVYVHSAFRTKEQQDELVTRRVTRAHYPSSAHNQGKAVDIVHSKFHWNGMTDLDWAYLGKIGKEVAERLELDIEWGGDWNFYDPAHWQVRGFKAEGLRHLPTGLPARFTPRHLLRHRL